MSTAGARRSGVVAIGRNEGERLSTCLRSALSASGSVVYVDSGSSDGSVELARSLGVDVVELDMSVPFTAARARNEGFARLMEIAPDLPYVQFVDGDCEIVEGWLESAGAALDADPSVAVVCGRRRERFPRATVYNLLCDLEWDTPVGPARSCGGDAMIRADVFRRVGGYGPGLISGEEPELCFRIRELGYSVLRLDEEMTLHDAAMTRFRQWWLRALRAGHAYAQNAYLHGASPERFNRREVRSIVAWGVGLPLAVLLAASWSPWGLALLALYPVQALRIFLSRRKGGAAPGDAALYAASCVVGKFPSALGFLKFHRGRLRRETSLLIEYK